MKPAIVSYFLTKNKHVVHIVIARFSTLDILHIFCAKTKIIINQINSIHSQALTAYKINPVNHMDLKIKYDPLC